MRRKTKTHPIYGILTKILTYYYVNDQGTYVEDDEGQPLTIKTDSDGNKYVDDSGILFVDELVALAYLKRPIPFDGYYVTHLDGNKSNCEAINLSWVHVQPNVITPAKNVYFNDMVVGQNGTLIVGKVRETATVCSFIYDPDFDLYFASLIPNAYTAETNPSELELHDVEKWMEKAGYISGDKTKFKTPVILHIDGNVENFASSNLVWCEDSDARFLNFYQQCKERQHRLILERNQGRNIPSCWP